MRCAQIALVLLVCVALTLSKRLPSNHGKDKPDPPQYAFGDIISSTMTSICGKIIIRKHYQVYVGKGKIAEFKDKADNQDTFHRWNGGTKGCVFGELSRGRDLEKVAEYAKTTNETTIEKMKKRILELKENCGDYNILENNCEHTATYVRFKEKTCHQSGTLAAFALRMFPGGAIEKCDNFLNMLSDSAGKVKDKKQCCPAVNYII